MPAKETIMQLHMDSEMKEQVEALYHRMGTSFAEAIRMFAAQSLLENQMPFRPAAFSSVSKKVVSQKGRLAHYADPSLISQEKNAMLSAMEEKHGKVD